MTKLSREENGFTVIELLIVITVLLILAALIFPVFSGGKSAAKHTVTTSRLKQMYQAMIMYGSDYDVHDEVTGLGNVPAFPLELIRVLEPYGVKGDLVHSAAYPDRGKWRWSTTFTYYWVSGLRTADKKPSDYAMRNRRRLQEEQSAFVVVQDTVHDYFEYWPSEEGSDPYMQRRFEINLRVNGSVKSERRAGIRGSILPFWLKKP